MKTTRLFSILVVASIFLLGTHIDAVAQNPTADLQALIQRVEAKLRAGKYTEMELARELNQFTDLLNKYRGQKSDEVAQILFVKATLYLDVLHDTQMAVNLLEQVKMDFPRTQTAQAANQVIRQIREGARGPNAGRQQGGRPAPGQQMPAPQRLRPGGSVR